MNEKNFDLNIDKSSDDSNFYSNDTMEKKIDASFERLKNECDDPYQPEEQPLIKKGYTMEELEAMMDRQENEERHQQELEKKAQEKSEKRKLFIPVIFVIIFLIVGISYNQAINAEHSEAKKYQHLTDVPMLYQTDKEWKDIPYSGSTIRIAGCGPTCLSMVHIYMNGDLSYDPAYMARFSERNNYDAPGYGTKWQLFSEGAKKLGLNSQNIEPQKQKVMENLKAGNIVVCVVGPGYFTKTGHFIVLAGVVDGKIVVNDPNAEPEDQRLWKFETFKNQIKDMWLFVKPKDKK